MTQPYQFTPTNQNTDRLDVAKRGGKPMIVKVWDHPEYVRTPHNKDGMVYIKDREPFPNRAIRALVVDLTAVGDDGQPGRVYPETWFQAYSMMKDMKGWIGQGLKLVTWMQDQEPKDAYGNPKQTNPYTITDYSGNPDAIAMAQEYLGRHPEVLDIPAPAPYDGKPPAPVAPPVQQTAAQPWGPPPQQWQGAPQGMPPGHAWNQQPPQQWQPPAPPQQPPSTWNTATPPPGYYQQPPQQPDPWAQQQPQQQWAQQPQSGPPAQGPWVPQGPPPQAPQGAPGSFFQASQGQQGPPQQYLPGEPNHQGQWQNTEPPF